MLRILCILTLAGCFCGAAGGTLLRHALRSQDAQAQVSAVKIKLGKKNRFGVGAAGLLPGDTVQRVFDLRNVGHTRIHAVSLTTVGVPSTPLVSDPVNGLQLRIDRCSKAWRIPPHATGYTCAGLVTQVLAPRPLLGTDIPLVNVSDLAPPQHKLRLLLTLSLPATATSVVMGQTSGITYTFTAA